MDKFVREGIIFSAIVFVAINYETFVFIFTTLTAFATGFQLTNYRIIVGQPFHFLTLEPSSSEMNFFNFVIDAIIILASGFASSYVKNSVMKK